MVFTPRNKLINDIDVKIHDVQIQRVYATKFLGVQIDAHLTWKTHIEYTCEKLSKCVGILCKARKKIYKSTLISLYYSFSYPYFIYCNHVWGQNYPSCLERISLIQKKLVRIITCSPFRAHTEPLYFANKILKVSDVKYYIIGIFMYECLYGNIPDIFRNYFSEMLMSMIIIFGMQMIYMYHMDDLISENSVSKLQEQIYGILFHRLLKTHNQFTYLRKI